MVTKISTRIIISGCYGRMGQAIARLSVTMSDIDIKGALERKGCNEIGEDYGSSLNLERGHGAGILISDDAQRTIEQGDVVIEFTRPDVTLEHAQVAAALQKPMVIGTTGFNDKELAELQKIANTIPIVFGPNMSIGVNVLFGLVKDAALRLGLSYDVDVVESHHRHKKDAPSGTAKRIAEVLASARNVSKDRIAIDSIREGEIVGDHKIRFSGPHDRLEISHHAESRDVFAQGALEAALFIVSQKPGWYEMADVLNSRLKRKEVNA